MVSEWVVEYVVKDLRNLLVAGLLEKGMGPGPS